MYVLVSWLQQVLDMEFIREKVHCPCLIVIAAYICMFNLVYEFFFLICNKYNFVRIDKDKFD